jgi:hypothetical protein
MYRASQRRDRRAEEVAEGGEMRPPDLEVEGVAGAAVKGFFFHALVVKERFCKAPFRKSEIIS